MLIARGSGRSRRVHPCVLAARGGESGAGAAARGGRRRLRRRGPLDRGGAVAVAASHPRAHRAARRAGVRAGGRLDPSGRHVAASDSRRDPRNVGLPRGALRQLALDPPRSRLAALPARRKTARSDLSLPERSGAREGDRRRRTRPRGEVPRIRRRAGPHRLHRLLAGGDPRRLARRPRPGAFPPRRAHRGRRRSLHTRRGTRLRPRRRTAGALRMRAQVPRTRGDARSARPREGRRAVAGRPRKAARRGGVHSLVQWPGRRRESGRSSIGSSTATRDGPRMARDPTPIATFP